MASKPSASAHYLGLDLGGTFVKAGVCDASGKILAQTSVRTGESAAELTAKNVAERMIEAGNTVIQQADLRKSDIAAVGILAPGQASLSKGIVYRSANLPLWKNVKLRAAVSKGLGLPGVLENDANAAAYGEWWAGAGKGKKINNLAMFTLGTGVGGGFVYNGHVIRGSNDFAAEVGHMIVVPGGNLCGCGQKGCLETYASAGYTGRRATAQIKASPKLQKSSTLGAIFKEHKELTAADVARHAENGDAFALSVWEESCRQIAVACVNTMHYLDPEMIVLGGGMSKAGKFLLRSVQKHFDALWWKMTPQTCKIALATLGNDAGMIGAAGVAKDAHHHQTLPPLGT